MVTKEHIAETKSKYYYKNHEKFKKLNKEYKLSHKKECDEYQLNYRKNNKDYINSLVANNHLKKRQIVIDYYSHGTNSCSCCGEFIFEFLQIDHENNDGAKHRKQIGKGYKLYYWLIENDFPEGFQVLCVNCNWGKYVNNGICPHNNHL